LLAVPDGTLYTPDALRAVLESSYRRGLPVVGFSAATVAAGTLATAYCAPEDVAADLIDFLDAWAAQGAAALPEARFGRYWRVVVNETVARSMGLPLSDKVRNLGNAPTGRPA
jgi:putative tryptophan/tyrosine transport system substrate-binding protein